MNELACFGAIVYIHTEKTNAKEAYEELINLAAEKGIEIYSPNSLTLKNQEGVEIEEIDF